MRSSGGFSLQLRALTSSPQALFPPSPRGGFLLSVKFGTHRQVRSYATFPPPPNYNWEEELSELASTRLPREHEYVLGESDLPEGLIYSALNPLFLGIAAKEIAELYRFIGTHAYDHPIQKHFHQLIVFNPKRRALHSLAAHVASTVCIYDDDHFVAVCEKLYPAVLELYNKKEILLSDELDACKLASRRFLNKYLYAFDGNDPLHNQMKFIENEMQCRGEKCEGRFDQARVYKAIMILIQTRVYKERVYPHVEDAVISAINQRLMTCEIEQIPDDIRGSESLWRLPVKQADERNNHIVAGGAATGKSASIAQFAARVKKATGKSGLIITAKLNVDWKRALIKLQDTLLSGHEDKIGMELTKQSWGALSHMEASIMNTMAMKLINDQLLTEGSAPDVLHETTFPDEETVNIFISKGAKLFLYLTKYEPDKAVDGNIDRFRDTGRLVPIEVVLGSQKIGAQMLLELVKKNKGNRIHIEHHDTQKIVHDKNATGLGIGLMDLSKNEYTIFDIQKSLELIKALHINSHAVNREQVYPDSNAISPAALVTKFIKDYGHMKLIFAGRGCMEVSIQPKNNTSDQVAYASFSLADGLHIYDQEVFSRMESQNKYSGELFNQLRNLTPEYMSIPSIFGKFQ